VTKPESCRIVYKEVSGFQPEPEERREHKQYNHTVAIQSAVLPTSAASGADAGESAVTAPTSPGLMFSAASASGNIGYMYGDRVAFAEGAV